MNDNMIRGHHGLHPGGSALRVAIAVSVLLLGGLAALAVAAPTASACPACDEYIWKPPSPGGKGSPSKPTPRSGGSSSNSSGGGGSATGGSGATPGPFGTAGTRFGSGSRYPSSSTGGWEGRIGGASGYGAGPEGAGTAGTGVLAASTNAVGGSPTGLLVLAAAALIGLAGLLAVWRARRRRQAPLP